MKHHICIILSLIISCSESELKQDEERTDNEKLNNIDQLDTITVEEPTKITVISDSLARFNGNFFSIKYPSNFIVQGTYDPIYDEHYAYFGTDELTVVSENGEVSFFVYSPQWGGEPINYLDPYKNEILFSDKLEEEANEPQNTSLDYLQRYFRCLFQKYLSLTTDNTNLVFGFQYKDEATKHLYQEAYMAFKNSLEQYAD